MMQGRISRRTVLKGLGTAVALPFLEAMLPPLALSAPAGKRAPLRMAFLYVPNGMHMPEWTPWIEGAGFELPATLKPLEPFREHLMVLSGLTADKARANGDGPGDHARAMAAFLTGRQPRKTDGANIRAGISVDQVAANHTGKVTRFPSLELGLEGGRQAGNCDSGYSCAYSSNLSWRSETTPMGKETNPRQVFERLFSNQLAEEAGESRARREEYRKSILDFVAEDARRLKNQLGANDQRKLDEYLGAIRELEVRITRAGEFHDEVNVEGAKPPEVARDYYRSHFQEHAQAMADLLALAFQGDLTRVATFVLANDGSNRAYREIGVNDGHHNISHHQGNKEKQAKIQKINQYHVTQLANLLGKLKAVQEGDGTLLDNVMLVYGAGIGDGNRHNHDNLPILLVGKGGGTLRPGRHVRYPRETPLTNLYVSMLERMDVKVKSLGDSKGSLTALEG
jgi:hypothetical protein